MQWLAWMLRRLLRRPQPCRIASHETQVWNPPPAFSREALVIVMPVGTVETTPEDIRFMARITIPATDA